MKKYSRLIDLTCWQTLIDRYLHLQVNIGNKRSEHLDEAEMKYVESIVANDLTRFSGKTHSLKSAMIFYSTANSERGLHVDYFKVWNNYPTWALNIPILNGNNCEMQWYGGDFDKELKTTANGSESWHLTWKSTPVLLESALINQPTVVYVDIPHNVINHDNLPRMLLTLRFNPTLLPITTTNE
jgi:hypothetical protein